MKKLFTDKEVLVNVFKLAPSPTEALSKFRFEKSLQLVEKAKGISCFMYAKDAFSAISEDQMMSYINEAILSDEGKNIRNEYGWDVEEHRVCETNELRAIADLIKVCEEVHQELTENYSLRLILKPNVNEAEFLDSLADLRPHNFARCIQEWCIKGAIKNSCGGTDLHRILSKYLSNVPSVQTLNKALRFEFEGKKRNDF